MEARSGTAAQVALDLGLPERGVAAVLQLLGEGATVPFVARYRKERTGGLDEVQIRAIRDRAEYLEELERRRETILRTIEEQGKLTAELEEKIRSAATKAELEDLYLPFKPKRRSKAQKARERGLEPLADRIWSQPMDGDPVSDAQAFVDPDKGVSSAEDALAGARDILVERVVEDAQVRAELRRRFFEQGVLVSQVAGKPEERTKFEDYYDHREPVAKVPSHRYLAIRRGEAEGVLATKVEIPEEPALEWMERHLGLDPASPYADLLRQAIREAFKKRLSPSLQTEVRVQLKMRSDLEAVEVFARNVEQRLLAPPFGARRVVGVDPGLRTGCKCAAVDETGRFLGHVTFYLHREEEGVRVLSDFLRQHRPEAVAVGNGTGGRQALAFVRRVISQAGLGEVIVVQENEAGASVYSASEEARREFPDLDVTVRGAISIARRLQDPLAELVKIEPKSIGVGQYQHDVDQKLLERKLSEVVESCVNRVGVEVNTASRALLSYVAGIGPSLADKIVAHRDEHGPFASRRQLLKVKGLGPKAFEQAAGFLRVRDGAHPLDASAVHPERYDLVEAMARDLGVSVADLVGNSDLVDRIDWQRYVGPEVGEPTLKDILEELRRPGRDPRSEFQPVAFREDVQEIQDLQLGMVLEGVVTNVTNFGAFVDVGVHHDGLVHVSRLAERFVSDPHQVVKVGDRLKVKVVELDLERKRIGLSARLSDEPGKPARRAAKRDGSARRAGRGANGRSKGRKGDARPSRRREGFSNRPFAALLSMLQEDE